MRFQHGIHAHLMAGALGAVIEMLRGRIAGAACGNDPGRPAPGAAYLLSITQTPFQSDGGLAIRWSQRST